MPGRDDLILAQSRSLSYIIEILSPTISFAPIAERLAAKADEIRSDLEGRPMIEQIYGVMWCIMLYCFVRICLALDAQANSQSNGSDKMRRAPPARDIRRSAARPGKAPVQLRLVASRDDDVPTMATLGMPGSGGSSYPKPREAGGPPRAPGGSVAHGPPRSQGCRKTSVFGSGRRTPISLRYRN